MNEFEGLVGHRMSVDYCHATSLDSLSLGSTIKDSEGDEWTRVASGWSVGGYQDDGHDIKRVVERYGPVQVTRVA